MWGLQRVYVIAHRCGRLVHAVVGASPTSSTESQSHATASARERVPLSFPSGSGSAASFPAGSCGLLQTGSVLAVNGTFRLRQLRGDQDEQLPLNSLWDLLEVNLLLADSVLSALWVT